MSQQLLSKKNRKILKRLSALLWLMVRSLFWTKGWLRWAHEKFPEPPENSTSVFTRWNGIIIAGLFVIAYGFYRSNQLTSVTDLINNFLHSLSWTSLANTILFIIAVYIIFAFQLRVRGTRFWQPFTYILLPLSVTLLLFFIGNYFFGTINPFDADVTGVQIVLLIFITVSFIASFVGFIYTSYRAIRNRMNAHAAHPALAPLIELALSAKALVIASQGQALVLWLPHVPSRLLILVPPAAAVVFYTYHTFTVQQEYMKRRSTSFSAELGRTWKGIANTRRPLKNRLETAWKFRKTQTFCFGVCILLLALALLLPSGLMQTEVFHR